MFLECIILLLDNLYQNDTYSYLIVKFDDSSSILVYVSFQIVDLFMQSVLLLFHFMNLIVW